MSRVTIFFLVGSLKVGGTEKVASVMTDQLMKSGYDVKLVLLRNIIDFPVDHLKENILLLNVEKFDSKISKIFSAYYKLWRFYLKYRPRRIVSFSSELNVLLLATMLPNQVFTVDTNLFWVKSKLYRLKILKLIGNLPNVKKVIIPSHQLRARFKQYLPKSSYRKLVTIHNPVSFRQGKNTSLPEIVEHPFIVSVGRLDVNKGFLQLIRCFAAVNLKTDYTLYIMGSGPMEDNLRKAIAEFGVQEKVKLLGFIKYPQEIISKAEALVLNSNFESFGNVLVEALSLGVPVISNDCDYGPREIIEHGTNGLLYDKSEDQNLIDVLENFVNSDSLRWRLKNNTHYKIERFNPEQITEEWIEKVLN